MKRELKFSLIFLLIVFLSLSFVSAFSFNEFWNKITGRTTDDCTPDCLEKINILYGEEVEINGHRIIVGVLSNTLVKFTIDGVQIPELAKGSVYTLADGSSLIVVDIIYQNFGGGLKQVTISLSSNLKLCGDNGCGGTCGACQTGQICESGACSECTPNCNNEVKISNDEEVELNGKKVSAVISGINAAQFTIDGESTTKLAEGDTYKLNDGTPLNVIDIVYQIEGENSLTQVTIQLGTAKVCGDDGCGGNCGSCGAEKFCSNGQCAISTSICTPKCDGKNCGDDGCGGTCGSCISNGAILSNKPSIIIGGRKVSANITGINAVRFTIDGITTLKLSKGMIYKLSDKSYLNVTDIIYQNSADGLKQATIQLDAGQTCQNGICVCIDECFAGQVKCDETNTRLISCNRDVDGCLKFRYSSPFICEGGCENDACVGEDSTTKIPIVEGFCEAEACLNEEKVCVPIGTRADGRYCDIKKGLVKQKDDGGACENSYECFSNECSKGKCISTYGLLEKIMNWFKNIFGGE